MLSWLTVERGAYLGLALLALVLRLANLGAHPLSDAEAAQSLVAWRLYRAEPAGDIGYSPLVATLNLLSFVLLGGNEFSARLGPALLGVVLVLLPYGLRRFLGREGALITSTLFAVSPSAVYLSRTVNADIGAAVGGLAVVVGLFSWLDPSRQSAVPDSTTIKFGIYLAAAGLVLMLTASPSAYSILVLMLGFALVVSVLNGRGSTPSSSEGLTAVRDHLADWSNLGLSLVTGLLIVATALLFNFAGLSAAFDLFSAWLQGFAPASGVPGAYPAIFLLSLYEPLVLVTGLFGLSVCLQRRRPLDGFLVWWLLGGIALDLFRPGRTDGEVLVPLVPLTLLGGLALGMIWGSLRRNGSWQREGVLAVTGLIIGGYAYISLLSYTRNGGMTFWLPVAGLGLFFGLVALFGVWYDGLSSLRGAALVAMVALTMNTIAAGTRLNSQSLADPRQPLVRLPAAEGLPSLMATLERISSWRAGDPYLLHIIADRRLGPAVEWSLRRFGRVDWVDKLETWPPLTQDGGPEASLMGVSKWDSATVLLGPADAPLSLEESYIGQDFAVRAFWSPGGLRGQSLIRWVLLREANTPVDSERVVLWVKGPPIEETVSLEEHDIIRGESIR